MGSSTIGTAIHLTDFVSFRKACTTEQKRSCCSTIRENKVEQLTTASLPNLRKAAASFKAHVICASPEPSLVEPFSKLKLLFNWLAISSAQAVCSSERPLSGSCALGSRSWYLVRILAWAYKAACLPCALCVCLNVSCKSTWYFTYLELAGS